jgi:hypothetical protein
MNFDEDKLPSREALEDSRKEHETDAGWAIAVPYAVVVAIS